MVTYTDLNYTKFPPLLGIPLTLDCSVLLFRSYDINYPILSDRPAYFSSYSNAKEYLDIKNRNLGIFIPNRELKLLDIRYVKYILNQMILERKSNDHDIINDYLTVALSFGLINIKEQLKLYILRYPEYKNDNRYKNIKKYIDKNNLLNYYSKKININPVELLGIRIGETTNDSYSSIILKNIFSNSFDGIISPDFESPYHIKSNNIIPCEILLFNPNETIHVINNKIDNVKYKSVIDILHEYRIFPIATSVDIDHSVFYYQPQSGSSKINDNRFLYIDQKNEYIEKMPEKEIKKIIKNSNKIKGLLNIDYNRFQKELDNKNNKKLSFDDYFPTMNINPW
jgi:hypothetical protein